MLDLPSMPTLNKFAYPTTFSRWTSGRQAIQPSPNGEDLMGLVVGGLKYI